MLAGRGRGCAATRRSPSASSWCAARPSAAVRRRRVRRAHVHLPAALRRRSRGDAARARARRAARRARRARSSSRAARRSGARSGGSTRASGCRRSGGSSRASGTRSGASSGRASTASTRAIRWTRRSSCGARPGSSRGGAAHELRRRRRDLGGEARWRRPTGSSGPRSTRCAPGGWRDLVTLLHPPYTAWHLSYVALGAAAAPAVHADRLLAALAAFFLARGRRARTRSTSCTAGRSHAAVDRALSCWRPSAWRAPWPSASPASSSSRRRWCRSSPRRVHRRRLQPRAVRRPLPRRLWFALAWGAFPAFTATGRTRCLRPEGVLRRSRAASG